MPYCVNCHKPVREGLSNCPSCFSDNIISVEQAIHRLEQRCLRAENNLKNELLLIRSEIKSLKQLEIKKDSQQKKEVLTSKPYDEFSWEGEPIVTPKENKTTLPTKRQPTQSKIKSRTIKLQKPKRKPSKIEKQIIAYFSPINEATEYLSELYASYKKEGK